MASFHFDESEILQELYAQVLETNGYPIERHSRLGTREIVEPALESGQIAGVFASSAGFPDEVQKSVPFPIFGKTAVDDFNYL